VVKKIGAIACPDHFRSVQSFPRPARGGPCAGFCVTSSRDTAWVTAPGWRTPPSSRSRRKTRGREMTSFRKLDTSGPLAS